MMVNALGSDHSPSHSRLSSITLVYSDYHLKIPSVNRIPGACFLFHCMIQIVCFTVAKLLREQSRRPGSSRY